MKVWSKGLFTYAEDDRVGVIKKLLRAVMTLKDIQASIIYLGPENVLFAICQDSVIYYLELNECIPGPEIVIDGSTTFAEDVVDNTDPNIKTKTVKVSHYGLLDNQAIIYTDMIVITNARYKSNIYYNQTKQQPFFNGTEMNKTDESFKKLLELKADQGARFYEGIINGSYYNFPVFTGFPSVTKADSVDVKIYNYIEDPRYNIIELIIYKKKINKHLYIVYRVLTLS